MVSQFFWDSSIFDTQINFILYDSGNILPSTIHNKARIGYTGLEGRASNIMKGIDQTGKSCYIMYAVDIKYEDIYTSEVNHYSGYVITQVSYKIWNAQGTGRLHKFYSYDGLNWLEWSVTPVSPQSVWYQYTDNNYYEASYGGVNHDMFLPIPYSTEFGAIFDGEKTEGTGEAPVV